MNRFRLFSFVMFFALMPAAVLAQGGHWNMMMSMPTARGGTGSGVVDIGGPGSSHLIYVAGGWDNSGFGVTKLEVFDPAMNMWSAKKSMPTPRYDLAGGVINGMFYAIGGQTFDDKGWVEAYDPVANTWSSMADMPTGRHGLAGAVVDGVFYAMGGTPNHQLDGGETQIFYSVMESYDPVTNAWTTRTPMPSGRMGLKAAAVNGIIYAIGGYDAAASLATVEAYDPATNTWTSKAPMSKARNSMYVGVVNGKIYVAGGPDASVEAYDPGTNTWSTETPLPSTNWQGAGAVVGDIFYTIGGAASCTFCFLAPNSTVRSYTAVATSVEEFATESPSLFTLEQNYPNPFNPVTTISYSLSRVTDVKLSAMNILGQVVGVLDYGTKATGTYEIPFDATGFPSGMYLYRLEAGDIVITKSMVLLK